MPTPEGEAIPFVSHRAFLAGVYREPSLAQLWGWFRRGAWLPQPDVHFVVEPVQATLGDIEFRLDGLNPTAEGERFILERDAAVLAAWGLRTPT